MTDLPDLAADPRVLRVSKRALPTPVTFAASDGVCETLEGRVRYRAGDAILTGQRGERWPVRRDLFAAGYVPIPPTAAGQDGLYCKVPSTALALRLDRAVAVSVGWRDDPLQGRPGDWLLQYSDGSNGIVQNEIFRKSYEAADGETRWPPD